MAQRTGTHDNAQDWQGMSACASGHSSELGIINNRRGLHAIYPGLDGLQLRGNLESRSPNLSQSRPPLR